MAAQAMDLGRQFPVGRDDLCGLMKLRGSACRAELREKYGSSEQLCKKLRTDSNEGIDLEGVPDREAQFGQNVIPMKKPKTFLQLAWNALKEPTLIILEGAAAISLGLSLWSMFGKNTNRAAVADILIDMNATFTNSTMSSLVNATTNAMDTADTPHDDSEYEWIEAVAILIAVVLVVLVSAINDYGKEKQFQALQKQVKKEQKVSVLRQGTQRVIPNTELVVGDICMLKYGDIVPADGIVLTSHDLSVDESSLTGESDQVKKHPNEDIRLLSGKKEADCTEKQAEK